MPPQTIKRSIAYMSGDSVDCTPDFGVATAPEPSEFLVRDLLYPEAYYDLISYNFAS